MRKIQLSYIFLFIGIFIFSIIGIYLYLYYTRSKQSSDTLTDLKENIIVSNEISTAIDEDTSTKIDFTRLANKNNDFIGWITIKDTNIDYPVMYTPDDEAYYLHRDFYKNYNYEGVPFCNALSDIKRPSDNIVIYGHNMIAGTMFSDLTLFQDENFYKTHRTFTFDTIYKSGTYEIIAVCLTHVNVDAYKYWEVADCTEDEFNKYVDWIAKNSLYKTTGIDNVKYGDKLVTLSTCSYHTTNGRLIVIGKRIDSDDIDFINNKEDCAENFEELNKKGE